MAEYVSHCAVMPNIPLACMNPVEHFILMTVFQHEPIEPDHAVYFFSRTGIVEEIRVSRHQCERALDQIEPGTDRVAMRLAAEINAPSQRDDPDPLVCFTNELDPMFVLHCIVRRHSDSLPYLVVQQALTSSRRRSLGIGGAATFITSADIEHICTKSWARERIEALRFDASEAMED